MRLIKTTDHFTICGHESLTNHAIDIIMSTFERLFVELGIDKLNSYLIMTILDEESLNLNEDGDTTLGLYLTGIEHITICAALPDVTELLDNPDYDNDDIESAMVVWELELKITIAHELLHFKYDIEGLLDTMQESDIAQAAQDLFTTPF